MGLLIVAGVAVIALIVASGKGSASSSLLPTADTASAGCGSSNCAGQSASPMIQTLQTSAAQNPSGPPVSASALSRVMAYHEVFPSPRAIGQATPLMTPSRGPRSNVAQPVRYNAARA